MTTRVTLKVITFLVLMMLIAPSVAQAQDTLWAKQPNKWGAYLLVDRSFNVYGAGILLGTVDFDPGPGTFELTASGEQDAYVLKLDRDGEFLWAGRLGGTRLTELYGFALDDDGNSYISGGLVGTTDFDPGPGTFELTASPYEEAFVCKLDSSGNLVWVVKTSAISGESIGLPAAVDGDHVYVVGYFDGTVDFDPGPGTFEMTASGFGTDYFVWKLDSAGHFVWARQLGRIGWDVGVVVAPGGYVYIFGDFDTTVDFDPGPGTFNMTPVGGDDAFLFKLDSAGDFVWAGQFGGLGDDRPWKAVVDPNGYVYTIGYFAGTVDFDPGPGTFNLTAVAYHDGFVHKLDGANHFVWAKRIGEPLDTSPLRDVAVDSRDNVYTVGFWRETMDFDPGPGIHNMTPVGDNDGFLLKLNGAGNFVWASQLGGAGRDRVLRMVLDRSDNLYMTGAFSGTVDVDPGPGTFFLTSIDETDGFISKFGFVDIRLESQDPTPIHFSPDSPSLSFDVATGLLSDLQSDDDFTRTTCLGTFSGNPATDDSTPPAGDGYYYLARGLSCCTTQGYGDSTLIPDPRDDLDALSPCP